MASTANVNLAGEVKSGAADLRRWLLAIDTSTGQAGVALCDGVRMAEVSWPGDRRHTTSVLPAIESLLAMVGIGLDSVGGVAVATGPGSFTGLRVGLSLAKGFAITGERDLIGIPTLDITASPYLAAGAGCIALVPAGRGRVVWAVYPATGDAAPPLNTPYDELLNALPGYPNYIVAGELTPEQRDSMASVHGHIASPALSMRRPAVLAELGHRRWIDREFDDPVMLEPLYLH